MKLLKYMGLAALVVIAFAACGRPAGKTEITYMAWYNTTESEAADIQKTLDKFNASQEKIHVTMIAVSRADYETKLNTMAAAKQLPDTCIMAEPMTIRYAAAGLLADMGSVYKPDEAPLKSLAFTYKGKIVGYSCADEVLLLYYNKKMFDEAKVAYPPASADKAWTWQEYVDAAKKLTKDKRGKTPNDKGIRSEEHRYLWHRFQQALVDVAGAGRFQRRRRHVTGWTAAAHRHARKHRGPPGHCRPVRQGSRSPLSG